MYKTIEVEFCEEQIEVTVELFNHDDEPTFSIESVFFEDVEKQSKDDDKKHLQYYRYRV